MLPRADASIGPYSGRGDRSCRGAQCSPVGGYGIRPYGNGRSCALRGNVGEHSICSRGPMQASAPTAVEATALVGAHSVRPQSGKLRKVLRANTVRPLHKLDIAVLQLADASQSVSPCLKCCTGRKVRHETY